MATDIEACRSLQAYIRRSVATFCTSSNDCDEGQQPDVNGPAGLNFNISLESSRGMHPQFRCNISRRQRLIIESATSDGRESS